MISLAGAASEKHVTVFRNGLFGVMRSTDQLKPITATGVCVLYDPQRKRHILGSIY